MTDRPVFRHNGEVTVTISSDEELRRLPTVYFAEARVRTGKELERWTSKRRRWKLGAIRAATACASRTAGSEDNSWEQTYSTNGRQRRQGRALRGRRRWRGRQRQRRLDRGWGKRAAHRQGAAGGSNGVTLSGPRSPPACWPWRSTRTRTRPLRALRRSAPEADDRTRRRRRARNPYVTDRLQSAPREGRVQPPRRLDFKGDSHSAVAIVSITLNGNSVSRQRVVGMENNKYTVGLRGPLERRVRVEGDRPRRRWQRDHGQLRVHQVVPRERRTRSTSPRAGTWCRCRAPRSTPTSTR